MKRARNQENLQKSRNKCFVKSMKSETVRYKYNDNQYE